MHSYETTVNYSDLGENARLSMAGTMRLLQEAACIGAAACDRSPQSILERWGVGWILMGWKIELKKRPYWGEKITITTWARNLESRSSDRDFKIVDEQGETVCLATSHWLLLDVKTGKVTKVPQDMAAGYPIHDEVSAFPDNAPVSGKSEPEAKHTFTYTALLRDMDTFRHMNNLHYLELAREALPEEHKEQTFDHVEILYKRQIKRGDTVHFYYAFADGKHVVELKDANHNKTHAILWLS